MSRKIEESLIDRVFRELTVIEDNKEEYVLCKCSCGIIKRIRRYYLLNGKTVSCGHYQRIETSKRFTSFNKKEEFIPIYEKMINFLDRGIPFVAACRNIGMYPATFRKYERLFKLEKLINENHTSAFERITLWIISQLLEEEIIKQYKDDRIIYKNKLPFDGYVKSNNLLIECQGHQHFVSVKNWGGENCLSNMKKRDLIKKEKSIEYGYKIIYLLGEAFERCTLDSYTKYIIDILKNNNITIKKQNIDFTLLPTFHCGKEATEKLYNFLFNSDGSKLISDYVRSNKKVKVLCPTCKNSYNMTPTDLYTGHRCSHCWHKLAAKNRFDTLGQPQDWSQHVDGWIKEYFNKYKKRPTKRSGIIENTNNINWVNVNESLRIGCHGFFGGSSLSRWCDKLGIQKAKHAK